MESVLLLWILAPLLGGALLVVAGGLCLRFAFRRLRARKDVAPALLAGFAGLVLILIGLVLVASVLMMLLYAWSHNPPYGRDG